MLDRGYSPIAGTRNSGGPSWIAVDRKILCCGSRDRTISEEIGGDCMAAIVVVVGDMRATFVWPTHPTCILFSLNFVSLSVVQITYARFTLLPDPHSICMIPYRGPTP